VENLLWHSFVGSAIDAFEELKNQKAKNFIPYPTRHREGIPDYCQYQKLVISIGSGDVESKIKQVGARVQLTGARWRRENVSLILRLRCAHLNHSSLLNSNALA